MNGKDAMENPETPFTYSEERLHTLLAHYTDQFDQTRTSLHTAHNWVITVMIGFITAVFAFDGGLFPGDGEAASLSQGTLLAFILALPLITRFFFRSCVEYATMVKYREVRNALIQHLTMGGDIARVKDAIQTYAIDWRCPEKLSKILRANLKLVFWWPFTLYAMFIAYAIYLRVPVSGVTLAAMAIAAVYVAADFIALIRHKGFCYKRL